MIQVRERIIVFIKRKLEWCVHSFWDLQLVHTNKSAISLFCRFTGSGYLWLHAALFSIARLLSLSFCLRSVSPCVPQVIVCLLTNWSVFLRAGWQVPLCLTIDRQPPHRQADAQIRTQSLTCSHMGLCPPSPDKLSLGPQINIQAKHWLYIIESRCHECTTGATLDAATMCVHAHTRTHTHPNTWLPAALSILSAGWGQVMNTESSSCERRRLDTVYLSVSVSVIFYTYSVRRREHKHTTHFSPISSVSSWVMPAQTGKSQKQELLLITARIRLLALCRLSFSTSADKWCCCTEML